MFLNISCPEATAIALWNTEDSIHIELNPAEDSNFITRTTEIRHRQVYKLPHVNMKWGEDSEVQKDEHSNVHHCKLCSGYGAVVFTYQLMPRHDL